MIVFRDITKQFGQQTFALQEVSFQIDPGEFVFLTGPSGSGKTTIMRLLTREYTPTHGEIIFDNTPLHDLAANEVYRHRRQLGIIFQDYKLLPDSNVWENIALPLYIIGKSEAEIESRVTDLLKLVNLTDKAFLFPSQLSGGEAQRVSIARALATGPQVIFADEPTGNLDPETSVSIAKLLHKINQLGTTVLLATHDLGVLEALKSERILRLEKGRLVEDTHATSKPRKSAKSAEPAPKNPAPQPETPPEAPTEPTPEVSDKQPPTPRPKGAWLGWLKKSPNQTKKKSKKSSATASVSDDEKPAVTVKVESLE